MSAPAASSSVTLTFTEAQRTALADMLKAGGLTDLASLVRIALQNQARLMLPDVPADLFPTEAATEPEYPIIQNGCRPCGRRPPDVHLTWFDMGAMGERWKGRRILICADCRRATGKARELGISYTENFAQLRCAGVNATRDGTWLC